VYKKNIMISNIEEKLNQRYNYFKKYYKYFPDDRFYTLYDYCDIYLKYFGTRYRTYLYPFCELLKIRGIPFLSSCQIEEIIWDKITKGDYKKFKPKRMGDLDLMNGIQFEVFLSKFFTYCGYYVNKTPITNDHGADLIMEKGYTKYVVQAKRHKKTIGVKALQEVYAAKTLYQANKAMVITTSKFSRQAINESKELHIELWDRACLKRELNLYNFIF